MLSTRIGRLVFWSFLLGVALAGTIFIYNLPPVHERLAWRVSQLQADIKYAISPPEEAVFTPDATLAAAVQSTLEAYTPTVTNTPELGPSPTATITPTPTMEPTPLPEQVRLTGIRHEYQKWNNCGPANLSMALSYWGWEGDQRPIASYVKPNSRDKNVMPYELTSFVENETGLKAITRVGGTMETLKTFLAAGFPVMVEKGFEGSGFDGWMGHYEVVTGYDDAKQQFTVQDSYIMPDMPLSYDDMLKYWHHFNYTYLVIYPPEREEEVMDLLGPHADETYNTEMAAELASVEIFQSSGRDQFFAWFNRGTNLVRLDDYAGAALAYDEAFKIDAQLAISDPDARPWRIMWYQTGPYWAYYYTGRYYDVMNLANFTIENMSEPAVEESFYWRALAREALGDLDGAIDDYKRALKWHPEWVLAQSQLGRLGVDY
ncbi:MAG: C39 family peptidase [Anaerolineales bacterium]